MVRFGINSHILYVCLALLGVILLFALQGWGGNNTSISNKSLSSESMNNLTALIGSLNKNTNRSTEYNPPLRACVVSPSNQEHSSEAAYTLDVEANRIPSILFGNASIRDPVTVSIGLDNNFTKHMTGKLAMETAKSSETIPFRVKSATTECLGHVGTFGTLTTTPSKLPDEMLDMLVQHNPPVRQCVLGTNRAEYTIAGTADLPYQQGGYQHDNITARNNPTSFSITLKSDLINGGALSAEVGNPFSIPFKDLTVDTKCISRVDFQ